MAELQQGLWVVKCEERYEPTFSYRWDLLESWLPDLVTEGRRLARAAALDRLVARYVAGAVFTTEQRLRRIFGVSPAEIEAPRPASFAPVRSLTRQWPAGRAAGSWASDDARWSC